MIRPTIPKKTADSDSRNPTTGNAAPPARASASPNSDCHQHHLEQNRRCRERHSAKLFVMM